MGGRSALPLGFGEVELELGGKGFEVCSDSELKAGSCRDTVKVVVCLTGFQVKIRAPNSH